MELSNEDLLKILQIFDDSHYDDIRLEIGAYKLHVQRNGAGAPPLDTPPTVAAIRRLFIANRGEIAVRIIAACRKLDIEAVVGVSDADLESLAARTADRAIRIGPPPASKSYLDMAAVVAAAKASGCDAIHPGYGFLAERADVQRQCIGEGL